MFSRITQEGQRIVHIRKTQKGMEGADGEPVPAPEPCISHVSSDPLDSLALLAAPFDHPLRDLDRRHVQARFGERSRYTPGPGPPLDNGPLLTFGEGDPKGDVVTVDVLEVVQIRQGVILCQGCSFIVWRSQNALELLLVISYKIQS